MINYPIENDKMGIIPGTDTCVFIKTGRGGTIYGYKGKYLSITEQIYKRYTIHYGKYNAANYRKLFAAFSGKLNAVIYGKLLAVYNTMEKMDLYRASGIYPGKNLIFTYETEDHPLDIGGMRKMLHEIFC